MPRAGQVKPPAPQRLGDRVAIGALTSVFPPDPLRAQHGIGGLPHLLEHLAQLIADHQTR